VERGLVDFDLTVLEDGLQGYYWDFPTVIDGRASVSRGIYDANLVRGGEQAKRVLGLALARRGIDIASVKLRPFSTRPFVPRSVAWVPGVVLVGEACGIDRTTGEGIAQALDMGRLAAIHLARALRAPRGVAADDFCGYERAFRASITGRHLLESAWLVGRVYGRLGSPARRYLLQSDYARATALRWFRGERLGWLRRARLGVGLLGALA
jgi:flavin-dependent dehydrogenase